MGIEAAVATTSTLEMSAAAETGGEEVGKGGGSVYGDGAVCISHTGKLPQKR